MHLLGSFLAAYPDHFARREARPQHRVEQQHVARRDVGRQLLVDELLQFQWGAPQGALWVHLLRA
jgi:hypothetical protein